MIAMVDALDLAAAGALFMLGAFPAHLRARGHQGTWAIRPWWLVSLGVLCLLAALALAVWPADFTAS